MTAFDLKDRHLLQLKIKKNHNVVPVVD